VVTVRGNEAEPAVVNDGLTVWPQYVGVERGAGKTFTARDGNGNEVTSGITWRVLGGGASGTSITSGGALSVALEETAKYLVVRAETSDGSNGTAVVTVAPLITLTLNSVTADGAANTVTTTELTLNFSSPGISGLVASDITLNPGLTKGTLTESGTQYKLGVSGISAETSVTVTVSKSGYSISGNGKAVTVYWWDPVNSPYAPNMVQVTGGSMTLNGTNVMLSSFWISNHEVTQKEWTKVMGAAPGSSWSSSYGVGDNYPVYYINWYDAVEFCNALSEKEGLTKAYTINKSVKDSNNTSGSDSQKWLVTVVTGANGYRLPTDAEWEYAARGGQNSQGYTYSGSDTAGDVAWYTDNSGSKTHPVGGKVANELGLYDMSGNVWEWCWDWYDSSSYPSSNNNPTGASSGSSRLHRGGSWYDSASIVPSANRGGYNPSNRVGNVGFRVARSATP
jgi:formylglycine-generating enzyme required for sulfatase activity